MGLHIPRLVRSNPLARPLPLVVILALLALAYLRRLAIQDARGAEETRRLNDVPPPGSVERAVVTAKIRREDISWVHALRPDWTPYIYTASRPPERGYRLVPPAYQGREATTYLAFIVDHYDDLPLYTAFVHADPDQWHNDLLGPHTYDLLRQLRMESVDRKGYVNLRCTHETGCPLAVNPLEPTEFDVAQHDIRAYFADVYMELFDVPREAVPRALGTVCCAQFVVSRARIRQRPRADYERMLNWAMHTTLTDSSGIGWAFEKVWHVIFGMDHVYCPSVEVCKCDLLGWCGPEGEAALESQQKLLATRGNVSLSD